MQALILTGETLPNQDPGKVWEAAAKLFKLDAEGFRARILSRCPLTIRETADESEARRISESLALCGAQVERVVSDGSKWHVKQGGLVSGPVPLSYLRQQNASRKMLDAAQVRQAANSEWVSLADALGQKELVLDIPPDQSIAVSPTSPMRSSLETGSVSIPPTNSTRKEPTGKSMLKAAGWLALAIAIYGGDRYASAPDSNSNPYHGRVRLISLGLDFTSCKPDGPAYKCVVRAPQPMEVREQCAYFDLQGRVIGTPNNVTDLSSTSFSADETRVVTLYAFDKEISTIECNYVPEIYKYDALMKGLGELKKSGVAWEIEI